MTALRHELRIGIVFIIITIIIIIVALYLKATKTIIIIIIIIKNEKIRVTLCENAAGALYIVNSVNETNYGKRN